ncbi:MAG: rRNA maturation RNase YbeY [Clostridia bacterium]|nr:rRNA maturation RNase YbeY [Clostridia bacterium]
MQEKKYVIITRNDQKKAEFTPAQRALIKRAAAAALKSEGYDHPAEISVTIVDNERIHELNLEYRGVDSATDVLSFPLNERDDILSGSADKELGDIVISIEKALSQAQEYGHSTDRELAFLTVHSVLHLLGYDHMTESEEADMFSRQEKILADIGLTR